MLSAVAAATGLVAQALAEPAAAPPSTTPAKDIRDAPPLVFVVAKGEADACGPGCAEWIAADGRFDAGAPHRLKRRPSDTDAIVVMDSGPRSLALTRPE